MEYKLLPHQYEAIQAINKCYSDRKVQKCGIVSIPTGGGKTYTAVYWIDTILQKNKAKILWFAQSFELLNQAYYCMKKNLDQHVKIKRVSSDKNHYSVNDIRDSDDVILITTQSAIKNENSENAYSSFINNNGNNLICILDEAHHAPAYGFRNMMVNLKEKNTNLWLLGLTATPTYTNESMRGWLSIIFDQGVIYEVEKELLQQQGILAREKYTYIKTPHKVILNEEDYLWLVKKHREIPEHIIEELAEDKERNEFIVKEYLKHRKIYGKTIIFLDRWYQCEYIKAELQKGGVSCEAIYSFKNDRSMTNTQVIDAFRKDKFEVLLNVKMLTEGADVPTVKTVFISHETQSYILFNQMIGRCLRGERAGGHKKEANIVLFGNDWSKSIAWYVPIGQGDVSENRIKRNSHPIYTFPIFMLEEMNKTLSGDIQYIESFSQYVPIGWYVVRYVEFFFDEDEAIKVIEDYVNVLEKDKKKYEKMIAFLMNNKEKLSIEWRKEDFAEEKVIFDARDIFEGFFDIHKDDNCYDNILKIIRHIAQNGFPPKYIETNMDLDISMNKIISRIKSEIPESQINILKKVYSRQGALWTELYGSFYNFKTAVDLYLNKFLLGDGVSTLNVGDKSILDASVNYESVDLKNMMSVVKQRDKACKCCGIDGKKGKLYVEVIKPEFGHQSIRNMQTLCSRCRKIAKGIDFTNNVTILNQRPDFIGLPVCKDRALSITITKASLQGSINMMYECEAVFQIKYVNIENHKGCEITMYKGNPLIWIEEQKDKLLNYIENELNQRKVDRILYRIID